MTFQTDIILPLLREKATRRRLRLGIFYRGNASLAEAIISEGHRTIIMGDRFHPLRKLNNSTSTINNTAATTIETNFDALPISPGSLDGIILTRGLPGYKKPITTLINLRQLLTPEGIMLWPHPITDGVIDRTVSKLTSFPTIATLTAPRHIICSWLMAAGFKNIGQHTSKNIGVRSWSITTAIASRII